jgi:hypothetical protein
MVNYLSSPVSSYLPFPVSYASVCLRNNQSAYVLQNVTTATNHTTVVEKLNLSGGGGINID